MANKKDTALMHRLQDRTLLPTNDLKAEMVAFYKAISNEVTPEVDGSGTKIIDQKPDGFGGSLDYIVEAYMRDRLNHHFPGWSWEQGQIQMLGSEWVIVSGHLVILDEHLLAFGKNPPERRFFGAGAARIQFKRNQPHTAENVIDIDKNVKSANSSALKVAINRLCGIGDDVYRKRIDEDGMGSMEQHEDNMLDMPSKAAQAFQSKITRYKLKWSDVLAVLEVRSAGEITDYKKAWDIVAKKLLGDR